MTPKQRNFFFADLWPKACRAQGWTGSVECEIKRRFVTLQATTKLHAEVPRMRPPTDRMSKCDQDQLTAVFNFVKLLGNPNSVKHARAAENPAEAKAADDCARLLFRIRESMKRGNYNYAYVQQIAAWDCREAQVSDWTRLPLESLRRVLIHLNNRANAKDPNVNQRGSRQGKAPAEEQKVYHMRPAKKFEPKPRPVAVGDDDNCPY